MCPIVSGFMAAAQLEEIISRTIDEPLFIRATRIDADETLCYSPALTEIVICSGEQVNKCGYCVA